MDDYHSHRKGDGTDHASDEWPVASMCTPPLPEAPQRDAERHEHDRPQNGITSEKTQSDRRERSDDDRSSSAAERGCDRAKNAGRVDNGEATVASHTVRASHVKSVSPEGLSARTVVVLHSALQHASPVCFGGHTTEPYEQKTQQSPDLGRTLAWQLAHS